MQKTFTKNAIWHLVILIIGTIFFLSFYSFKDAVFFWILMGISYQLRVLTLTALSTMYVVQLFARLMVNLLGKSKEDVIKAGQAIYEIDDNSLDTPEFSRFYELLAFATSADMKYQSEGKKNKRPNKTTVENIISSLFGLYESNEDEIY